MALAINDYILSTTGGPSVMDGLVSWLKTNGATNGAMADLHDQFLTAQGFTTGTLDDRWDALLVSLGYTGSLQDKLYEFWKGGGVIAGFSPLSLFSGGQVGVWYDPSDFSTLFENTDGTGAISTVEKPVGKMLDKSGNGFHVTAANNSTARPIFRNRYNRLTNSEVFDSGWTVIFASVTANTEVAPNGTTTADTLTVVSNSYPQVYQQALGVINPALYIASVYAKAGTNDQISLELRGPNLVPDATFNLTTGTVVSGSGTIVSAGNGWYRCSVTTTTNTINPLFIIGGKANSAGTVYIWGAQLTTVDDHAAINQEYQSITTATSYNSDTTKFPPYLEFDGADDCFIPSSNLDFSASNKVSVFCAVSKNLVTNFGIVAELSASAGTNNGAFALWINGDTGGLGRNTHGITLRGTTNFYDEAFRPYPSPANAVLSYIFQPGEADQISSRINGSPVTASSTLNSTSAGNFGNYPLYIGSRAGATLRFGGRLYGLIVRAGTSTAQEISDTETYLSGKSGVAV